MKVYNNAVIVNGDMSGDITSSTIWLGQTVNFSAHAVVVGSAADGALKVQVSNDMGDDASLSGVINWADLTGVTVSISGEHNYYLEVKDCTAKWAQIVFTKAGSSAGTLDVRVNSKGV